MMLHPLLHNLIATIYAAIIVLLTFLNEILHNMALITFDTLTICSHDTTPPWTKVDVLCCNQPHALK
jgi:hypothetical protein